MKLSDYLLVLLFIIICLIAVLPPIVSYDYNEFFSSIFLLVGTVLFAIKGWKHENFYRFIRNDSKLSFFEYFELEIDRSYRIKPDFKIFLFLLKQTK